jgi:molybdopterin-binding protein
VEVGDTVECQIKEASISVCKERGNHKVSIENQIAGSVTNILKGDILCELTLDTPSGTIKSLITSDACERMEVKEEDEVTLLFKAVDIKMQPALPSDAFGMKNAFAKTH